MSEVKSENMDEEMKDDVNCVRDLLDRLKDEKEKELLSAEVSSSSEQERDAKQPDFIAELQKKQASVVMNLKPVHRATQDQPNKMDTSGQRHEDEENNTEEPDNIEGSQKRKQDQFLIEIQERAEVISKSARKAPESMVTSIGMTNTLEGDPETEEFLKIIRTASSAESKLQAQNTGGTARRRKSTSDIDFSVVVSNCSVLNVEPQKSKIPLGRQGSLKGRRKPTASVRRRSLRLGAGDDWGDADKISEGEESMDEGEGVKSLPLQESFMIKDLPQLSESGGARPRTKPKHRVKSKTVSGIALPGLAEELNKRMVAVSTSLDLKRPQGSAAEIVRAAAEGKHSLPVKEEKADKEPEKPSWLVEAEARRKLHEKRRQVRTKVAKDVDDGATKTESGILRSTLEPEPVMTKVDDDAKESKSHNVSLRPFSKTETTGSKTRDGDVGSKLRNGFLRPVLKSEQTANRNEENDTGNTLQSIFLRPVLRSTPITNKSKADTKTTKFPTVFLRPITRTDPVTNGPEQKPITKASVSKLSTTSTDRIQTSTRGSSEFTSPISPTVKPVTQSSTYNVVPLSADENIEGKDCNSHSAEAVSSLETPQYHTVRSVRPVSLEKLNSLRQGTSNPEISPSQTSHSTATKVTVSSNYVITPPKVAPKTRPKPSMRSKTVTVTATEVPQVSTTRRTSTEMIHAKAEQSPARPSSAVMTGSQVTSSSDFRAPWRGSEYRPTYTGEVLPQWKVDLMERKRNATARGRETNRTPDPSQPSSATVVAQWKKDLANKRRQRVDSGIVQTFNKENQPKTSPEIPQWKREFAERRKRRENSPVRQQPPDSLDRSADASEWRRRLSAARRMQANGIPRSQTDEPLDPVPSYMREFEKKKKRLPRGGHTSYV